MVRKKASDFPQELLDLFDGYVHGGMNRREFLDGAQKFAVGGVTAAALFEMLRPNYAWAIQVPPDDTRIRTRVRHRPLAAGQRQHQGLSRAARRTPANCPAVLVDPREPRPQSLHRGRRAAAGGRQLHRLRARRPDLASAAIPATTRRALALFGQVDRGKMAEDFLAAARVAESAPGQHRQARRRRLLFRRRRRQQLAVRMGADLAAAVPFYGVQPSAADAAKIKAPLNAQYAELDTRITGGWPAFDAALTAGARPARGPHLQRRQPRLPQRHHPALRRSRGQGSVAAHAGLVQQIPQRVRKFVRWSRTYRDHRMAASAHHRKPPPPQATPQAATAIPTLPPLAGRTRTKTGVRPIVGIDPKRHASAKAGERPVSESWRTASQRDCPQVRASPD